MAVQPPPPTPAPTPAPGSGMPAWLVLGVALVVTGGVAELLYKVSPTAGYLFALLVIMGYMASGGRSAALTNFLATFGIQNRG